VIKYGVEIRRQKRDGKEKGKAICYFKCKEKGHW